MPTTNPPLLVQSGLTGSWFIVTRYKTNADGAVINTGTKYVVTEHVRAIQAEAWEQGSNSHPGEPNPYAEHDRSLVDDLFGEGN